MHKFIIALSIITAAALPAQAEKTARTIAAQAAGYVAAFTCSASFNAGRTPAQIKGDELNRIYPDYRKAMATLPEPVIDRENKIVSVRYADDNGGARFDVARFTADVLAATAE